MTMKRRLLALTLTLAMALSVLTTAAFAAGEPEYNEMAQMTLNNPVLVTWNRGEVNYYRFTPPETGYYTFTPASKDLDYYDMTLYNLEDWTVGGAGCRIAFTSFMLRGGQYVFTAGGDEVENYTVTVTKTVGFSEFLSGSEEWNVKEEPEKTVTLPATTFEGTYQYSIKYYAVPIHVPETGRYRFIIEKPGGYIQPYLLDEDGRFFAIGLTGMPSRFALDLEGGKTYYMLPDRLGSTAETITLRAEQVEPAEICLNGYSHSYSEQSFQKATLTKDGVQYLHCDKCERTEPVTIPSIKGFHMYTGGEDHIPVDEPHFTYDGTAKEPYIFAQNREGEELAYSGLAYHACPLEVEYSNNVNAGTATAKVTMVGDYYEGSTTLTFQIDPMPLNDAEIEPIDLQPYTGSPVTPKVAVTLDGKSLAEGTDYTVSYENNVAPGIANITVQGKGNYTGTAKQTFAIIDACTDGRPHDWKDTIKKASFTEEGGIQVSCAKCGATDYVVPLPKVQYVKLSDTSYTYDGKAKKPTVAVGVNAGELLRSDQYKVTWSNNTNAGTATAKVTLTGDWYEGTKKLTFPIKPAAVSKAAAAAIKDQTYTGKALKPAVKLTFGGKTLTAGTDYTLTYRDNKAVGTASVTVNGKGNFTGTKKVSFRILPKGTTISKLTAGKKKLTVKWKKQTTQTTGYELQYSTDKKFKKSVKTVTVKKPKTTSVAIKKLTGKKTYYVRIRTYQTVRQKTYPSPWSKAKSAVVK